MFNVNDIIYKEKATRSDKKITSYRDVLEDVTDYINEKFKEELAEEIVTPKGKERYKFFIREALDDLGIHIARYTEKELIELLYNAMARYDFLTPFLDGGAVDMTDKEIYHTWEEINGNSYDDIEVKLPNGYIKLDESFASAEHCTDIIRKLSSMSNCILDKSNPRGDSFLGDSIRMTATVPPCIDKERGASFSIRRQLHKHQDKNFFIRTGTASEEEMDFLLNCFNYGVSIAFAGATGTGKTTDINYLLNAIDGDKRIYTVEDVREFDAIKKVDDKYISRTVHTVTKKAKNRSNEVTADDLLRDGLRYDPDVIALGEMRGKEAKTTIAAGNTGHTIITGLHAGSCRAAYRRIMTMYLDAGTNLSSDLVLENVVEAIPIMVIKKAFPSGERRYMTISEARVVDNKIEYKVVYKYVVDHFDKDENGKITKVYGTHKKVGNISYELADRLYESGVDLQIVKKYAGSDYSIERGQYD